MPPGVRTQYSTAEKLLGTARPSWLSGLDATRLASYTLYEDIYWNVPEAFKVIRRGDASNPIYIPSGKQIVETLHRFMANDFDVITDPDIGTDSEREAANAVMKDFLRRERFVSAFTANKRLGIIRGDWLFHIYAEPDKPDGSRISIVPLDPASYFPLYSDVNPDVVIGCHIAEQVLLDDGSEVLRRVTYRKQNEEQGGPSPITYSEAYFELDAWGQPGTTMEEKVVEEVVSEYTLPDPIDSIPVYHIRNFDDLSDWGSSEMRGLETLIGGINQSVHDEDVTLALDGLGLYKTTSGPPEDEDGNEAPWQLGPGHVVEIAPETDFERVSGVGSITPYQDHIGYLHEQLDLGSGTPEIAKGKVDVQVAESGVALAIQMGPLLSRAAERELGVTDVTTNMFYDLRKWFAAYEPGELSGPLMATQFLPSYGDKIPLNRDGRFKEVMEMVKNKIVSLAWARRELEKVGYEFGDDTEMISEILDEAVIMGRATADPEGLRLDAEIDAAEDEVETDEDE